MKKFLLATAALLCCSLAFAQEAEGDGPTIQLIPRVGADTFSGLSDDSGLYTLIEGNIGETPFSYSIEGHFLSSYPAGLYADPQFTHFLDWAYVNYNVGKFNASLGKQILAVGTFEQDEYDVDSHSFLNTTFWNNLETYVWGANVMYGTEDMSVTFQIANSPMNELNPFESGCMAYSVKAKGDTDGFGALYSFNYMQTPWGDDIKMMALGNKIPVADFDIIVDATVRGTSSLFEERSLAASLVWNASDDLTVTVKGSYEFVDDKCSDVLGYFDPFEEPGFVPTSLAAMGKNYWSAGAFAHWYPFENLRVHAAAGYNNFSQTPALNVGVTYWFDLAKFLK